MKNLTTKKVGIKEVSSDQGSQVPSQSDETFSVSKEMELKQYILTCIELNPHHPGIVFALVSMRNKELTAPFTDEELQQFINEVKIVHENQQILKVDERKRELVEAFKKNNKKGTFLLAQYITKKYDIITVGEKEREMFIYRDGVYFQAENEIIYPEIQTILGDEVNRSAKSETFNKICDMTSHPRSIFSTASLDFIPLQNGVFNFKTKELLPHSPEYKFKYKFPVVYSQDATCPKTLLFMQQVLSPLQILTVQEWIGYYFYRSYMFKKAIIFVGEGDTGKTTLLEVITHLLGRSNISSISLQKMSSDKFSAAHLYEKHGNIVDELSAKDISDTGAFKVATGGGSITGEYKFGNQFSFHNFSKFTFACNKIPDVTDFDDLAYFNRWIVIRFENTIEKKIPNFISTLATEEERSGLFNWAMEGLSRLLERGRFTYAHDADETKMEMLRSSSSAGEFIAKCIKQDVGAEITKEDMYEEYSKFCTENNLSVATKKSFGMKFITLKYVSDGLVYGANGKRVEGWRNVSVIKTDSQVAEADKVTKEFNEF